MDSIPYILISSVIFALLHSLTASQGCKQWAARFGLQEPRYRFSYSMVSLITTLIWVAYIHTLPDSPLYHISAPYAWLMYSLQATGVALALAAFIPIDGLVFLGWKAAPNHREGFIISGVYRYIRHPMYTGAMLILLFKPEQSVNGSVFALMVCLYFIIGSRFEERRMQREHPDYTTYQQSIPAFIPKFHQWSKEP